MNDHYYTSSPESRHKYEECTYVYRDETVVFTTDAGVFSKGEIDYGTNALLNALPDEMAGRILDLGCGWGAIGVSVGKKYVNTDIVMCDVNERAIGLARQNAERNGVHASFFQSDGLANVPGRFDTVITNPPIRAGKAVIYRLFSECRERLTENGSLFLVIRKQQGAESAVKYLQTLFEKVNVIDRSGGFWTIQCKGGKNNEI